MNYPNTHNSFSFSLHSIILNRKCCHIDEIYVTVCTINFRNEKFQCSQWQKFCQHDDIFISVYVLPSLSWCVHYSDITAVLQSLQSQETLLNVENLFRLITKSCQKSTLLALCEGNPPPVTDGFLSMRAFHLYVFCHFLMLLWCIKLKYAFMVDKDLFILLNQYHDCRCPTDARSQGISSDSIEIVLPDYSGLCTKSMQI